ncbi:MAG: NAD(P)/FAD-dependent oxidoreductase [Candidatus Obscuribacterales bacterium]|nr:NAD(P)/FAD-dependent oxidoreductase [Candidatus Obscuribacterales bacterium]
MKVVVIGGGINGLVAANYLQRNGFAVTMLEKKTSIGGACTSDVVSIDGKQYRYSNGASAFGFMQDFVFEETGLAQRVVVGAPEHPEIVYFDGQDESCLLHDDVQMLKQELKQKWSEEGDVEGFIEDMEKVCNFLIANFKSATIPSMTSAVDTLGQELSDRWISGSARDLLNYYFTSEKTKMFFYIEVTESGPVEFDSPYSAFNVALMNTGAIFDGKWGFVSGGIGKITETLADINAELGVNLVSGVEIRSVAKSGKEVRYVFDGQLHKLKTDYVVFATDPLSAARLLQDSKLEVRVSGKKMLGTSGKVLLFFKNPVQWKGSTGATDFDSAFRFIINTNSPGEFAESSKEVELGKKDFSDAYFEVYCEGAGRRRLGDKMDYDVVAVFLKNLAIAKTGIELPEVKQQVEDIVLSKILNREDLIGSLLFTPKDIRDNFFMPQGNIDHIELCDGQNFFARTFSANPSKRFYQFGRHENVYYCGAGAYPCGSVAGTVGYMCAQEIIRRLK